MENDDDKFESFENVGNHDDSHDFVLVQIDIVAFINVFYHFKKSLLVVFLDVSHELACVQQLKCLQKSQHFDQVKQSAVPECKQPIPWNER